MTTEEITELLKIAYRWGRDNGSNRSEKNFNDLLQTEAINQALSIANVVWQSEHFVCDHCDAGCNDKTKEVILDIDCYNRLISK